MSKARPGDVVDITIKNALVVGINALTGAPTVRDERGDEFPMPSQAAVTRVEPLHWPPMSGDLWRDGSGVLWFCRADDKLDTYLVASSDNYLGASPEALHQTRSPLTLIHREEPPF